jgi:hypothetical protein
MQEVIASNEVIASLQPPLPAKQVFFYFLFIYLLQKRGAPCPRTGLRVELFIYKKTYLFRNKKQGGGREVIVFFLAVYYHTI